jgi:phage baseplate assembly protein V
VPGKTGDETNNLFRIGIVQAVNPSAGTVRVRLTDKDDMITDELAVLTRGTMKNRFYGLPDVGEQVLCCFMGNGMEVGFVLGSIYSPEDPVPVEDQDVWHWGIPGGFGVQVNRRTHEVWMTDFFGTKVVWKDGDLVVSTARTLQLCPEGDVPIPEHLNYVLD